MSCTDEVANIEDPETAAASAHPLPPSEPSDSPRITLDDLPKSLSVPQHTGPALTPSVNGKPAVRRHSSASSHAESRSAPSITADADATLPHHCACKEDGRNLVVCIDGTSNQFSKKNTNVVELYSRLKKDSDAQITFYNSGIGTYAAPSWKSWSYYKQVVGHKIDLAIAWRFERILLSAYVWLSENYKDGDCIFLFGFSRGAYQVRALSAMIELIGLIHRGNEDQIPFAYELYANAQTADIMDARTMELKVETASMNSTDSASTSANLSNDTDEGPTDMHARFKATFSRAVRVHFVGAWDTVSSVGIIREKNLTGAADGMSHVCYFRHALALHERRVKFLPEYVRGGLGPDLPALGTGNAPHAKEIWFAGSHSDIGGGSGKNEKLDRFGPSLRWMSFEATQFGLLLDKIPREWKDNSKISNSLSGVWRLFECMPFRRLSYRGQEETTWWPHLGKPRVIKAGQRLHESAVQCKDRGRAVVSDGLSWDLLIDDEHVERDAYAAAGHVYNALGRLARRPQPLKQKDLQALSVLLRTERGRASLRDLETAYGSKRSESLIVPLISGLVEILKDGRADPNSPTLSLEATRTVFKVLETLKARYRPEQLRSAARALAKAHPQLADELMTGFSDPALRSPLRGHTESVGSVAFLPDCRRLVSSSQDGTVRIWDTQTGETVIGPLEGHANTVPRVTVHGSRIASCSYDGTFRVWDADSGKNILGPITAHDGKDVECIAYSRDGTLIATAGQDSRAVLWDAETGAALHEMVGHTAPVICVAFSEDGTRLVSGSEDNTVCIWDVASGECIGEPLTGHNRWVTAVCFSPDDKRLFSSSNDTTIRIWDAETRALIVDPMQMDSWVLSLALSPDGKRLVSSSYTGKIAMWDADTGVAIRTPFRDHGAEVWGVAFSPDGRMIASASQDKTIALWNATDEWKRYDIDDEDVDKDNA